MSKTCLTQACCVEGADFLAWCQHSTYLPNQTMAVLGLFPYILNLTAVGPCPRSDAGPSRPCAPACPPLLPTALRSHQTSAAGRCLRPRMRRTSCLSGWAPKKGRPWTWLPEYPGPVHAPTSMSCFPPPVPFRARLSRYSLQDAGSSPSPQVSSAGKGVLPGPPGSAGRQGAQQPGHKSSRKSRPGSVGRR